MPEKADKCIVVVTDEQDHHYAIPCSSHDNAERFIATKLKSGWFVIDVIPVIDQKTYILEHD